MNFFQAQEDARRRTKWLRLVFYLSVLAVMTLIGLLVTTLFYGETSSGEFPLEIFIGAALLSGLTIIIPYGFKSLQLSQGGDVVARDLGGRPLDGTPSDFNEQRLMNIVEEMALASGVPVPQVYVMDREQGINAFAAGTEPTNAVIGVTRGCLDRLTREELQGVIAHEFSHILNGDMKLNMKMIGWVCGLMGISLIGQMLFRSLQYSRVSYNRNHHRQSEGNQGMIVMWSLGLGLMFIGGIGVFFGRLLQAAISRQREYLADSSAVQFTRNPATIAGALKKIGGLREGSRLMAPKAAEASHMFFSDGGLFSFGFATHPPLRNRIKRIEADWDESFASPALPPLQNTNQVSDQRISGFTEQAPSTPKQLPPQFAEALQNIPQDFITATRMTDGAQLLIISILLSAEGGSKGVEAQALQSFNLDIESLSLMQHWSNYLQELHSAQKILLIDLATPTLRRLSPPVKERFIDIMRTLIQSDREISLFEYMLQRIVERHLLRHEVGARYSQAKYNRLEQILPQLECFADIMEVCGEDRRLSQQKIQELDAALNICERSTPALKERILNHMTSLATSDNALSNAESELLRTIAVAFGCVCPLDTLVNHH